jgi:hypothetical protein
MNAAFLTVATRLPCTAFSLLIIGSCGGSGGDGVGANGAAASTSRNRGLGDTPALCSAEISDVIAFLETLTDGFQP